jgi:hypothetical protein
MVAPLRHDINVSFNGSVTRWRLWVPTTQGVLQWQKPKETNRMGR